MSFTSLTLTFRRTFKCHLEWLSEYFFINKSQGTCLTLKQILLTFTCSSLCITVILHFWQQLVVTILVGGEVMSSMWSHYVLVTYTNILYSNIKYPRKQSMFCWNDEQQSIDLFSAKRRLYFCLWNYCWLLRCESQETEKSNLHRNCRF